MSTIVILESSCTLLCRLSWFWNHPALCCVDYRDYGIFMHFIMSTIVIMESSCALLCRLSWFWNICALYYVDYRNSGIILHFVVSTIVILVYSCTLLCRLPWFRSVLTIYYTTAMPSQPLRVRCWWIQRVTRPRPYENSEVRETAAAVNAYPDITKLPARSLHTRGNVLVRPLPFV